MPGIDFQKAQREDARWRILIILDAARPYPANELLIWRALSDQSNPFSRNEVRRELCYLEESGLVRTARDGDSWFGQLTADGIDFVDYTAEPRRGIGRPPKYWGVTDA